MLSPEYGTSLIRADASNRPIIIPMAKERTKIFRAGCQQQSDYSKDNDFLSISLVDRSLSASSYSIDWEMMSTIVPFVACIIHTTVADAKS